MTIVTPDDPNAPAALVAPGTVALPSVPLKTYPGVRVPIPLAPWIFDKDRWSFDLCFAQNAAEAARLEKLGARAVQVSANLKYAAAALP